MGVKIWKDGVTMAFLNKTMLSKIEKTHPHLPSLTAIITIVLCSVALLLVILELLRGDTPAENAYWWLTATSIFMVGVSAGIIGEIHWRPAREYVFAFIIGSAFSFIGMTLWQMPSLHIAVLEVLLLLCCITLTWRVFFKKWSIRTRLVTVAVLVMWLTLFSLLGK